MIANLVSTIMLALGVATGNVSSNSYKSGNAFNHIEKPIQKANSSEETEERTYDDTYFVKSTYAQQLGNGYPVPTNHVGDYIADCSKYYFEQLGASTPATAGHSNDYYYVSITSYRYAKSKYGLNSPYAFNGYKGYTITIVKVESRIGTHTEDYTARFVLEMLGTQMVADVWAYEIENADTYCDQTVTINTIPAMYDTLYTNNNNKINPIHEQIQDTGDTDIQETIEYRITNLEPAQPRYIYFMIEEENEGGVNGVAPTYTPYLNTIDITGVANIIPINYEVIDFPDLIYTILTMPFAFYSQAFNLTIFPGTAYQINFGNVILTLLAALMLMFILKKVLK